MRTSSGIKPTLGLVGATVNAMALIAPGAFLWITIQMQAAATAPSGASVANDMWCGIVVALGVAFLTAYSYSQLARIYPEAGFASCTYFAEKAFLDSRGEKSSGPQSLARMAKLATGWSAHLFYWVYPGIMVAMMAILIGYIYTQFSGKELSPEALTLIGIVFAAATGYIAYRGVTGSTRTAFWINAMQLVALVFFSGLAIWYRLANPAHAAAWSFTGAWDVLKPHTFSGVLVQSTLAILILVGFESCTALAAETKDPKTTIPKAIIISLVIQGLFAYLFEYFAAGYMVSDKLAGTANGVAVTGMAAAAASSAPLGDMTKLLGNAVIPGFGFGLMVTMAITVGVAVVGTTLSCMNTAMRISCGMAEDRELPRSLSFIHDQHATPHIALGVLILVTSAIAAIGVRNVVGLTGITLASNFGTFVLYGLTCAWTVVAFKGRKDFNILKHGIVPVLGVLTNVVMLAAILYLGIIGGGDSKKEALICLIIAGAWLLVSLVYIAVTTVQKTYSMKMVSCMIRPEQLQLVVEALKDEDLIMGMTVTKVKGFGRQKGRADGNPDDGNGNGGRITFVSKLRVDLVVKDWDVPRVMDLVGEGARTGNTGNGNVGDGKIFVIDASDAMRIRTGEKGVRAI
jgi:amino acid transporter